MKKANYRMLIFALLMALAVSIIVINTVEETTNAFNIFRYMVAIGSVIAIIGLTLHQYFPNKDKMFSYHIQCNRGTMEKIVAELKEKGISIFFKIGGRNCSAAAELLHKEIKTFFCICKRHNVTVSKNLAA